VAEGVETGAQCAFLRAEGCHAAQGFHIARPLPAGDFAALLGESRVLLH
jgi:EAL domain-containing protein (putative c-di-GMP-specific phosphodiesterase class I)